MNFWAKLDNENIKKNQFKTQLVFNFRKKKLSSTNFREKIMHYITITK